MIQFSHLKFEILLDLNDGRKYNHPSTSAPPKGRRIPHMELTIHKHRMPGPIPGDQPWTPKFRSNSQASAKLVIGPCHMGNVGPIKFKCSLCISVINQCELHKHIMYVRCLYIYGYVCRCMYMHISYMCVCMFACTGMYVLAKLLVH
jgi:hypothetical protein